jgi:hypothetical protein
MFYTNKFPMLQAVAAGKGEPFATLPTGTVFTIQGIAYADAVLLKPINRNIEECMNTTVSIGMLNFAFTASESVSVPKTSTETNDNKEVI